MKPMAYLGDAAVSFVLIIALCLGVDVKWIVLAMLIMTFVSEIAKAFSAIVDPLIKAIRG